MRYADGQECRPRPSSQIDLVLSKCGTRQRGLLRALAKHSHTAHVLSSTKIHYPHHPRCGDEVTVVRRCRSFGLHQIQVVLPSGDQLVIPEWMLDEHSCCGMEIVEHPTLSISSLFTLRDLLHAQHRPSSPSDQLVLEASSPGGASCEPTPSGPSSMGDSTPSGASPSDPAAMPRAAEPDAAGRGQHHTSQPRGDGR